MRFRNAALAVVSAVALVLAVPVSANAATGESVFRFGHGSPASHASHASHAGPSGHRGATTGMALAPRPGLSPAVPSGRGLS